MDIDRDADGSAILERVLLPVADAEDALATARALEPYDPGQVIATHVVEKGEGVPDKTPVEQSEAVAEAAYGAVRSVFPDAETHTAYGRDVVDTIDESAAAVGASAIVFQPRGGNRLVQFLSGDRTLTLVTEADRPVITLPRDGEDT